VRCSSLHFMNMHFGGNKGVTMGGFGAFAADERPLVRQAAVVLGATGVVGYGATYNLLKDGAVVVAVGRNEKKLQELKKKLGDDFSKQLELVVHTDYTDEKSATTLLQSVMTVLVKHIVNKVQLMHVVSTLGWLNKTEIPSKSGVAALKSAFDEGLYPNVIAAQAFLPTLKQNAGATFSLVSGGLAHFSSPQVLNVWNATVKNAAINAFFLTLAAEVQEHHCRVGNFCIHFGVTYPGGDKNQWEMPAEDTVVMGQVFSEFAKNQKIKSQQFCLELPKDFKKSDLGEICLNVVKGKK